MHLAYIISQYPAISHTFVQREILALRRLGFSITTISIRKPNPAELLTPTDQSEAAQTHIILPPNPLHVLAATLPPLPPTPPTSPTSPPTSPLSPPPLPAVPSLLQSKIKNPKSKIPPPPSPSPCTA